MASSSNSAEPVGLLLCDDMIFTSRITGTARAQGITVKPARSTADLLSLVAQQCPTCVILDLANPGLQIVDLLEHLRTTCSPRPTVVAYGSHVDTATLRNAREAGCDVVLPRSKFVEDLPRALAEWMKVRGNYVELRPESW
jgi:CheY-like chemotaxis protein